MSDSTNTTPAAAANAGRPAAKKPRPATGRPPAVASVNRKALIGPEGPVRAANRPRERLAGLLSLSAGVSDSQLFDDAAHAIERLKAELSRPRDVPGDVD